MLGGTTVSGLTRWKWPRHGITPVHTHFMYLKITITRGRDTKMYDCLKIPTQKWPCWPCLKSILWIGPTTVHLQLPLHLTDLCLLSVSGTGAAVGNENKQPKVKASRNYWPSCHCNILSTTHTHTSTRPMMPESICCLAMSKNYSH